MSDDKRSFFRRGAKKDEQTVDVILPDEAVVENPTPVQVAVSEKEPTQPEENSIAENAGSSQEPKPMSNEVPVFTPRGMEKKQSPVEDKIQNLMDSKAAPKIPGWNNLMSEAPTDGSRVMVSEDGLGIGVLVYWRISKFVDKTNLRYVPRGRWTDFTTRQDLEFVPRYWKAYNAEEYYPLTKPAPEASK